MKSERLTKSNRVNALKSSGPRSVAGKAVSCMNRLTTGMYATSLIIFAEKLMDFELLQKENYDFHIPATPEERFHLDVMIRSEWQLRRFDNVEAQIWEYCSQKTVSRAPDECLLGKIYYNADTVFARLERQRSTVYRTYKDASAELAALQAARYEVEQATVGQVADLPCSDPVPSPQPIATETSSPEIGFVPSVAPVVAFCHRCSPEEPAPAVLPAAAATPIGFVPSNELESPAATQIGFVPSVAPVVAFCHRCPSEEPGATDLQLITHDSKLNSKLPPIPAKEAAPAPPRIAY